MTKCLCCGRETKNPKFCSSSCSAKITCKRKHSEESKQKVSEKLSGKKYIERRCFNCNKILESSQKKYCSQKCQFNFVWETKKNNIIKSGTAPDSRNLKRYIEEIKNYECEKCNISLWFDKPLTLELHHINGNNKDNRIENVLLLCPNCHSLEHLGDEKSSRKVNNEDLIFALKSYKTISEALSSLNMTKSKSSYNRCKRLIASIA